MERAEERIPSALHLATDTVLLTFFQFTGLTLVPGRILLTAVRVRALHRKL